MKRFLLSGFATIAVLFVSAQQNVKLSIQHKLGTAAFGYNVATQNNLSNDFKLTRLQYYLSGITIVHDGGQTTTAGTVYALVDASQATTIDLGNFPAITTVEGITFAVGVNTPQNNQDPAQWPASHALSPKSPSMHWGWASGYFFVALEGQGGAAFDQTIELHALGNSNYFSQTIATGATSSSGELLITVNADYTKALKDLDVSNGLVLHGGNSHNATMMVDFRDDVFSAVPTQTNSTGLTELSQTELNIGIYPNPGNGQFSVDTKQLSPGGSLIITDGAGKQMAEVPVSATGNTEVILNTPGIYFISVKGTRITRQVIVR